MDNINGNEPGLDKSAFSVVSLFDESADKSCWHSQTPQARIDQIQILRKLNYGDEASSRLQRVLEVIKCEWS